MKGWILASAAACAAFAMPAQASNIVTNGDFETGNLNGWSVVGGGNFAWSIASALPGGGSFGAATGCVGVNCLNPASPGRMGLEQTLATGLGSLYTLTFDYSPVGGSPNGLNVLWNGIPVLALLNLPGGGTYTSYTVPGLVATGSSSTLTFLGRQDPNFSRLDNISVVAAVNGAVPEPSTWALMLLGFFGLGAAVRRQGRQTMAVSYA